MNRDWDKVFFKSSAYWMSDLRGKDKDIDISTNISTKGDHLQEFFERSAEKMENLLLGPIQCDKCQFEEEEIVQQEIMEDQKVVEVERFKQIDEELEVSSSELNDACIVSCSECKHKLIKKKKYRINGNRRNLSVSGKVKKRFTVSEDQIIINKVREGFTFAQIAHVIPGTTQRTLKHRFFQKLRQKSDNSMENLVEQLQELSNKDENIENRVKEEKIHQIKSLIDNLENSLNDTKHQILEQYLAIVNQQSLN